MDGAGFRFFERPEVFVAEAVVVVEVELGEVCAEGCEGFGHGGFGGCEAGVLVLVAGVGVFGLWSWLGEVGVAGVEAEADVAEVADADDLYEVRGSGYFVAQVFEEQLDAEWAGEGFEVFDGGEGGVEGAGVPAIFFHAEVEDAGAEGDLLGGLEGALDFVLRVDACGL